ncbi:putative T7SS-secreted protein [Saccharopolyspora spinosa]|uniref:RNase toxin 28 of polymorphic toxin system n=1 Tax=Saccharopolyspora spinosa TaxID=60894 RepID=A0A2N3XUK7_SACSN|nr:polymorphic toxin type 28 domain-containing protein [Saccharopolyspora spinosa]PKW14301.1 putative RNase toxin 28 of polymorphic toxin system [Saccharopolyspora spinosa]
MAAELGTTNDPKALVPGDADALHRTSVSMTAYGDMLCEAGEGLKRIDSSEGWSGEAAEQFRSAFDGEPIKWLEAGDCFHYAATALERYGGTLTWAQVQAGEAIRMWNEGEAATQSAQAEHARLVERAQQQVPAGAPPADDIPFTDPGEAKRQAARETLSKARSDLAAAGEAAADAIGRARDKAPDTRSWLAKAGDAVGDAAGTVVNAFASVGNAAINHPGMVLGLAGGAALTAVSAAGETAGVLLDATGVGALGGVPLGAVSTAGIATGVGIMGASMAGLAAEAAGDDEVNPIDTSDDVVESTEPLPAEQTTKTDRIKEHLTEKDLDAARRELNGEVVARKPNGEPWDHVDEVQNAQRGLVNRIEQINRQLGDSRTTPEQRAGLESELSEASRLLDHSEGYVPRG